MPFFKGFHGLLPRPEDVAQVAAVPYDVVDGAEAAALAEGNPLSFLRVSRAEIEMPTGTDPHSAAVYEKSRKNFARLVESAPLLKDTTTSLYVYSLAVDGHEQTGILGLVAAADYEAGLIKKHEKTRPDKEDDRTRHLLELSSHTGPVFLTHKDDSEVDRLVFEVRLGKPLFDFSAPDGVRHRLWRLAAPGKVAAISARMAALGAFYVADGHHRAAAAARAAAERRRDNPAHRGDEEYNFFLAGLFPASQLKILAYNRVVLDLNGLDTAGFLGRVAEKFELRENAGDTPGRPGEFRMYIEGKWFGLVPKFSTDGLSAIGRLDVSVLQDYLLSPILGIDDPRSSKRIQFVGGIRGAGELVKLVDSGKGAVAFSMFPTTIGQLLDVADAGGIMPPKSTWFEPKLRDGLVCHNF